MITDNFWKLFWVSAGIALLLCVALSTVLFFSFTDQTDLVSAVGVTYEEGKDPFQSELLGGSLPYSLSAGYFYQNALPLYFKSWTWEATADWRSGEQKKDGEYSLKAEFRVPGGTVGMNGPTISTKDASSLALSVWVDSVVEDLYLNMYDSNGNSLGQQSVGWYAQSGILTPNEWHDILIPLENLLLGSSRDSVNGISISGKNAGIAYVDNLKLSSTKIFHVVWVAPPLAPGRAFNPFATSTPAALPYTFSPAPELLGKWYTYYGSFRLGKKGLVEIGPSPETKSTGSMTVLRSGVQWSNYEVHTTINWGAVSVFSLLARFVDDGNFVSCAFSRYGEAVQIYHVVSGKSTQLAQTPGLAVPDWEPWVGVSMGVRVKGNRVSCILRGDEVVSATIEGLRPAGTVGFETWDPNPESAPHTLVSLSVKALSGE